MNPVLQHGFYYKFEANPETIERLLKTHPPDARQRRLCDLRDSPHFLWSFYQFKKESIVDAERNACTHFVQIDATVPELDGGCSDTPRGAAISDPEQTNPEEAFFFRHARVIDYYMKHCLCVEFPVHSLKDLCVEAVLRRGDPKTKERLRQLPERVRSWIERDRPLPFPGPMPRPKRTTFRSHEERGSLRALFSEKDARVFSGEFVAWFRRDPSVLETLRPTDRTKVVFFHFRRLRQCDRYYACVKCMKWIMVRAGKKTAWERRYYSNAGYFKRKDVMQTHFGWCRECERVPLFQILSREAYDRQYGDDAQRNGLAVKVEVFL